LAIDQQTSTFLYYITIVYVIPKKTDNFNKQGIERLSNDKPVVYKIQSESGANNYTGIAQRGRVRERVAEHLSGSKDPIPGAKVLAKKGPDTFHGITTIYLS